jgi:hypothetical protein
MKLLVDHLAKSVDSCCKCAKKWSFCVALKINSFKIIQYRCVFFLGGWKRLYNVGSWLHDSNPIIHKILHHVYYFLDYFPKYWMCPIYVNILEGFVVCYCWKLVSFITYIIYLNFIASILMIVPSIQMLNCQPNNPK